MRVPPWVEDLALVLSIPVGVAAGWALAETWGPSVFVPVVAAILVAFVVVCLGDFGRTDPIGFASIVGPPTALVLIALAIVPGRVRDAVGLALCWVILWLFAMPRLWPWWSRNVLRRYRAGSPAVALWEAWRDLLTSWRSISSQADGQAVWNQLVALERFENERTRPVIDGAFALWELQTTPGTELATMERASARLREEWGRLWQPPRARRPFSRSGHATDRPTRATRLEYCFPRLEAVLAVASPDQQRRIAALSVRQAAVDAGMASPALERALDQAAQGRIDNGTRQDVDTRLQSVRGRRDELAARVEAMPDPTGEGRQRLVELSREAIVLSAVSEALADDLSPVAAADVLSESIRSENDHSRASAYEDLARLVVGPDMAAGAVSIEPASGWSGEADDTAQAGVPESERSALGRGAQTGGGLGRIAVTGLAAGVLGTLVRQITLPVYAGSADASLIGRAVGVLAIALLAYAMVRVWLGRPSYLDVLMLYIGSVFTAQLVGLLVRAAFALATPITGTDWIESFVDPRNITPYAPVYGIVFAAVLVAGSLILRPRPRADS